MLEQFTDNSIETQRKWLKFLLERVGHNNLPRLIDYYKNLGWISAAAGGRLLELAEEEKRYRGTSWTLSAEEHKISRLFIEKLEGKPIDESLLIVSRPGKAVSTSARKMEIRPEENKAILHPAEKKKLEFEIHRRKVAITNLEEEIESRDTEIIRLNKTIQELLLSLEECQKESRKKRIFMGILDQNTRLRKAERKK